MKKLPSVKPLENERLVLALVALFYTLFLLIQDGIVDTADGILHYQYARFAADHPENFFNHWAKPVFTLVAFLPAQAGLIGVKILNILLVTATAGFVMKTAQALKIREWALAGLLSVLGNSVTYVVLGGLTEPSMMLVLSTVMYTAVTRQFKWMYFLLGLSLMVRPEAIVMIAVFGIYGLTCGKWKETIWGLLFPLFITISGMLIAGYEWSWIVTQQPYNPGGSVYGHGEWTHYYDRWSKVTPYITLYLALGSIVILGLKRKTDRLIPIVLTGFGIIALHVFLWRFGKMGSAGLVRTLTTALPALALLAAYTLSHFRYRALVLLPLIFFAIEFKNKNDFPSEARNSELAAQSMAQKIEDQALISSDTRVAYQFATTAYYLDIDPFDREKVTRLWSLDRETASSSLKNGDILIWDNMTGHREGGLTWERISNDPHVQQIDSVSVNDAKIVSFRIVK